MAETYYTNQNITDNINTQNYYISPKANSVNLNYKDANKYLQIGGKNFKNYAIEELPQKEEDIDHLQRFHLERGYQSNINRINSINTNKIPHFPFEKSLQNENTFNRGISGKIPHPKKINGLIPVDRNKIASGMITHRRNASGERPHKEKQIHSKYSSASENRANFLHRISGQKFEMGNFSSNNYPKINNGPFDSTKSLKNQGIKPVNNMNNTLNKINSQNYQNLNMNFSVNNDVNIENPRLTTVGIRYLNNSNNNISPFLRAATPQQTHIQDKDIEIAKVTKISSSNNTNFMKNNNNQKNKTPTPNNFVGQILGNNIIYQGNQNQIRNNMANNYLTQQQINQLFNNQRNEYIPSIPSKTNLQSRSNYNIYSILSPRHINTQNSYGHIESERATIVSDKINNNILSINSNQIINNSNDSDLIYNDFGGKGLVKNYNGVSRPGKDASGKTKTNQDSFVIKTNINNLKDFNIFGVLDGHGEDGHFVSEFVSELIPSQIINHPEIRNLKNIEAIYKKLKENNCKIINESFIKVDKQLQNMEFDVSESGCTCCLIIQIGAHIICANTGDSRAILAYDQANSINKKDLNYLDIIPLSLDYKPELPEETNRIIKAGGEVEQLKDEYGEGLGPYRVWAKGKDYPGLAMSRSIGDLKGKSIGVIPDPGILEYNLNSSTKFIVAGSDGIWEFLDNQTVINLGKKFYLENKASDYCHELVSKAFNEWKKNEKIVDDITAVIVFF